MVAPKSEKIHMSKWAHSSVPILKFHFQLIELELWNTFCEVSPKVCFLQPPEAKVRMWHCEWGCYKKLIIGIPVNIIFCAISPKLQRTWRWNFRMIMRKIWASLHHQKLLVEPWGWECDKHIPYEAYTFSLGRHEHFHIGQKPSNMKPYYRFQV